MCMAADFSMKTMRIRQICPVLFRGSDETCSKATRLVIRGYGVVFGLSEATGRGRLPLQLVKEIGCYRDPHEDDQPNTSSEKIVVVEEITPETLRHIMPKEKFKGDCHAEPHQTNGESLPG